MKSSQKSSQLQEWIAKFIESRPSGTSKHTLSFYHTTLRNLSSYPLTPQGINQFLADLTCGNGRRNYYIAIRAFCNWLYRYNYIESNPIQLVEPPKTKRKLLTSPTADEVDKIIQAADLLHEKCLVSLAFSSGLRLSELARIEVPDVDLHTMTVRVVVKGNRESRAVFDDRTKVYLEELIGNRVEGSLFGLKPRGIQDMLARLSEKSGIKFSCHSLRRAFASNLRRKGLDISHIMILGNWQDLSMPLRYSASVSFEDSIKLYRAVCQSRDL